MVFLLARTQYMPGMVWRGCSDGEISRETRSVLGEEGLGPARGPYMLKSWNLTLSGSGSQDTRGTRAEAAAVGVQRRDRFEGGFTLRICGLLDGEEQRALTDSEI